MSETNVLVVAMRNRVLGMNAATGARLWQFTFPTEGFMEKIVRLAIAGDTLYAVNWRLLVCIHIPTGQVVGQVETARPPLYTPGTLLVTPDRIVLGSGAGPVQCFSREGQLLWQDDFADVEYGQVALALGDQVVQADAQPM